MNLKLWQKLRDGFCGVVGLVVVAKHLLDRPEVLSEQFETDGFKSAEGDKHDIVGIILIHDLSLLTAHGLLLFWWSGVSHKF